MTTSLIETVAAEDAELRTVAAIYAEIEEQSERIETLALERAAANTKLRFVLRQRAESIAAGGDGEPLNAEIRQIEDSVEGLSAALELLEGARTSLKHERALATRREADTRANEATDAAWRHVDKLEAFAQRFAREFLPLDAALNDLAHAARRAENDTRRARDAVDGPNVSTHIPTPRWESAWRERGELFPLLNALREYAKHTPTEGTP